ncbi:MAG: pyrophosphatase, partial [Brachybacterium sp.]|nr:pyrophosphatase [Brachybacterium sp.]
MNALTAHPLGHDVAWTLIALVVISALAITLSVIIPRRLLRDEDAESIDDGLGGGTGVLLAGAIRPALVVGIPVLIALAFVPATLDGRLLRSGMYLAGLLAASLAAWRGASMMLGTRALDADGSRQALGRLGGLFVAASLAIAAAPAALAVWFLGGEAGTSLLAFAAGAVTSALAL